MRPAIIIVLAVLIVALLAFDAYEYDGHYRDATWENVKYQAVKIDREVAAREQCDTQERCSENRYRCSTAHFRIFDIGVS